MKRKTLKRALSIVLVIGVLLSLFAIHASAATVSESESNNDYASANVVALGDTVKGIMGSIGDADYYKIQTSSNGKVSLNFNHVYADLSWGWNVYVYIYKEGKYTELSNTYVNIKGDESIALPSIGAISSGIYYLKVTTNDSHAVGREYQIITSFTFTNYYERELNNDYATATPVSLGNTYGGNMNSIGDVDYYKIQTSSNGKVSLNFNHVYADLSWGWNVYVYIYKEGKYTELSNTYVNIKGDESIALPSIGAISSGIYYLKVTTNDSHTIGREYQIITSLTSTNYYERELNNDYATATPVSLGNTYGGNMNSSSDVDYYKIISEKNETIQLKFNHTYADLSWGWNVYVYVYKEGKYTELSNTYINIKGDESIALPSIGAISSGIYYLKVTTNDSHTVGRDYAISISGTASTTNYTVTYNANGGSVSPSSATVSSGNSVTLPTPTKSYTISYNANGGSGAPSSQSVSVGCKGWSTSSSAISASYSCGSSYKPTSNTTLYAVWNSSASANLSSSKPTRSGYKFLGWSTNSGATSASYSAGQSVSLSGNVTLYAVWERVNDPEPTPVEPTISGIPGFINWVSSWANSNPFFMIIGYVIVLPLGIITSPIWVWLAG